MGRMYVAHFKSRALPRQTTRAQCGNTALVGDLRQRVGLIHELRQLAGAEKLLDRCRNRLGIDQVMRHQVVALGLVQALFDCTLNAHQAGTELVFRQFADRAHAAVAQMVDIIDFTTAIAQFNQYLDHIHDVFI